MPYAPGIQSLPLGGQTLTTGQSLGQGYANLGAGFAEWAKNDLQNNKMKSAVMGTIAQDPSILNQFTDQNTQKVITKVRDGNAGAKDIAMAYGYTMAAKEQKQQNLQNQFIQAQLQDVASQAKLRSIQGNVAQRNFDLLQSIMGDPNSPQGGAQAPAGVGQFAPQGQAPQGAAPQAGMAPQPALPTMRDSMLELVRGTGQMPDAKTVSDYHQAKIKMLSDISTPGGYVEGATETGPNNTPVVNWYPVSKTRGGTITREKEPIKIPVGIAPPGMRLDPTTYQPIAGAPVSAPGKSPILLSKDAQDDIKTTSDELNNLLVSKQKLEILKARNAELNARVPSNLAPIAGSNEGKVVLNLAGNDAPMRFDTQAAPMYSDIMANIKGLRTQMEFNAVTGQVPKANQSAGTRADQISVMENALNNSIAIRQKALNLMQSGALPASAWAAARNADNSVVLAKYDRPSEFSAAVSSGVIKPGSTVILEGTKGSVDETGNFVPESKAPSATTKAKSADEIFAELMKKKKGS